MSSIRAAPVSDFIYSTYGWYRPRIPGMWFVRALERIGVEEPTVRMTLFRMERRGALAARKIGRAKFYEATASTKAIAKAARARVFDDPKPWDGKWSIIAFAQRPAEAILDVLQVNGFAELASGTWIHPRDHAAVLHHAGARNMIVFRGQTETAVAKRLWPLADVAARYRRFVRRFARVKPPALKPYEAFVIRYAMMFEFFRTTWNDPELPPEVLPRTWPGTAARELASTLYKALLPAATVYGDAIMSEVIHG